uniref:Uncharacterized protein n=1 Tax=Hucho hucho TaxID=62062 RepID=A0A4W5LA96_9TELE
LNGFLFFPLPSGKSGWINLIGLGARNKSELVTSRSGCWVYAQRYPHMQSEPNPMVYLVFSTIHIILLIAMDTVLLVAMSFR